MTDAFGCPTANGIDDVGWAFNGTEATSSSSSGQMSARNCMKRGQVATSILAQANQTKQNILVLFKGFG